ncbi:hypothetical protein BOSE21B_91065 [Bosea sp. 21B]|nr:hypothetical protein BOSE7B_50430 [Bosea sp. 7B]CAD5299569.1 hypothetical protein BOSE21B_91065 [Bosea sp. 21B]VXB04734.1 hypothetical protein BOSE127_100099 [Bosea sp. 127]
MHCKLIGACSMRRGLAHAIPALL